jgi:deoxyribodipyrimidine photolyase
MLPASASAFVPTAAAPVRALRATTTSVAAPCGSAVLAVPTSTSRTAVAPTPAPLLVRAPNATGGFPSHAAGGKSDVVVVLFRSDLRIDDHAALTHAIEEAGIVVPVFCFDPRHFGRTAYGFEKTGRYRASFLIDSVRALRETMQGLGCELVVRIGKPEEVVVEVCKRVGAKRVFLHAETTYEEQQVEEALEDAVSNHVPGGEVKKFWGNTLYHADDLPFDMESIPDVYSDFREAVETSAVIRAPLKAPETLTALPSALEAGQIPSLAQLNIDDTPDSHVAGGVSSSSGVGSIQGGEPEAMRRVASYVNETRRADSVSAPRAKVSAHLGADFSCRISPWLALGCVSPRRIYAELKAAAPVAVSCGLTKSATYFELVWRDFFRFITCKYSASRLGKSTAAQGISKSVTAMTL